MKKFYTLYLICDNEGNKFLYVVKHTKVYESRFHEFFSEKRNFKIVRKAKNATGVNYGLCVKIYHGNIVYLIVINIISIGFLI